MIDVGRSRELTAVILTFKTAPARVRSEMKKEARKELNRLWKPELERRATTRQQKRVLVTGARAKVGSDTFSMLAATSRRRLSGGLLPNTQWPGAEFGMSPRLTTVRARSRKGVSFTYRRRTGNQFPNRRKKGYVVYPAARDTGQRVVAGYVVGAVRGLLNSTEMETV